MSRRGRTTAEVPISLPRSEESERAVLAAALLDPARIPEIADALDPEDFYADRHRAIWRVVTSLQAAAGVVDVRTVQAELDRRGLLAAAGGLEYLAGLDLDLPDLGALPSYVAIVRDRALRRRAIDQAQGVLQAALGDTPTAELVAGAEEAYRALTAHTARRGLVPVGELVDHALERLEEGDVEHLQGIPTGWPELDRVVYGLGPGRLIVLAGRPRMGKSTVARQLAAHVALREGRHVAIWSLEMSSQEVSYAILGTEAQVPSYRLRDGHLSTSQWQAVIRTARALRTAPLHIDDRPDSTVRTIRAEALRRRQAGELDLVIIDYLQLMSEPAADRRGWAGNRNLELAAITGAFKRLARELEIPVVLLSQLSRDPDRRSGDHRPRLADLRDSGAVEQDSDLVLFIYREELYKPDDPEARDRAELIIGKHRHGEEGTVHLTWHGPTTRFTTPAQLAADPQAPHQQALPTTPAPPPAPKAAAAAEPDPF